MTLLLLGIVIGAVAGFWFGSLSMFEAITKGGLR
jgi:hypothetical protein